MQPKISGRDARLESVLRIRGFPITFPPRIAFSSYLGPHPGGTPRFSIWFHPRTPYTWIWTRGGHELHLRAPASHTNPHG